MRCHLTHNVILHKDGVIHRLLTASFPSGTGAVYTPMGATHESLLHNYPASSYLILNAYLVLVQAGFTRQV